MRAVKAAAKSKRPEAYSTWRKRSKGAKTASTGRRRRRLEGAFRWPLKRVDPPMSGLLCQTLPGPGSPPVTKVAAPERFGRSEGPSPIRKEAPRPLPDKTAPLPGRPPQSRPRSLRLAPASPEETAGERRRVRSDPGILHLSPPSQHVQRLHIASGQGVQILQLGTFVLPGPGRRWSDLTCQPSSTSPLGPHPCRSLARRVLLLRGPNERRRT